MLQPISKNPKVYTVEQEMKRLHNRAVLWSIGISLFILSFMSIIGIIYSRKSDKYNDEISQTRIANSGELLKTSFDLILDSQYQDLEIFNERVKHFSTSNDKFSPSELSTISQEAMDFSLDNYGIICDGVCYLHKEWSIGEETTTVFTTDSSLSTTKKILFNTDREEIYFILPSLNIKADALIGILKYETLFEQLNFTLYQNEFSILLMDSAGTIQFKYSKNHGNEFTKDIYTSIQSYSTKTEYEDFKTFITSDETILILQDSDIVLYKGISNYDTIDYTFLLLVPEVTLTDQISKITHTSQYIFLTVLLVSAGIIIAIIFIFTKSKIKAIKEKAYNDKTDVLDENHFFKNLKASILIDQKQRAIVIMNILSFKKINNIYGTKIADELLKEVGSILNENLTEPDFAGYLHADNFLLCLTGEKDEILFKLDSLYSLLNAYPYENNIKLDFSFGVKMIHTNDLTNIHHELDCAKFAIKRKSKDSYYSMFDEVMFATQKEADELNERFQEALANHEFEVFLQLKWNLKTNSWGGAEALVRWRDPQKGLIPPGKFIPLFEENGNITALDAYVFEEGCKIISMRLDNGEKIVPISFNLSKRNFVDLSFIPKYLDIVETYKIPHELIEFEITEGLIMDNEASYQDFIKNFHEHGFNISMDDFGAGYSSLNMIHSLDFDIIKIDQKFFRAGLDESNKTIVSSIIALCHKLGKKVVAEGVENKNEVDFLNEEGCDYIQGYYFAKPVPYASFKELMEDEKKDQA